uniref:Scol-LDLA n=1 Tax=Scolopendra viridis TaxID=118503 RepID=A0A4D5R8U9_SCOVI
MIIYIGFISLLVCYVQSEISIRGCGSASPILCRGTYGEICLHPSSICDEKADCLDGSDEPPTECSRRSSGTFNRWDGEVSDLGATPTFATSRYVCEIFLNQKSVCALDRNKSNQFNIPLIILGISNNFDTYVQLLKKKFSMTINKEAVKKNMYRLMMVLQYDPKRKGIFAAYERSLRSAYGDEVVNNEHSKVAKTTSFYFHQAVWDMIKSGFLIEK